VLPPGKEAMCTWLLADTSSPLWTANSSWTRRVPSAASWRELRLQAIEMAGHCLRDLAPHYPRALEWQMVVTNEAKEAVLRMRFLLREPGARGMTKRILGVNRRFG